MSRYDDLMALEFPETVQHLTRRDTILYALGVGAEELDLVIEDRLRPIPSMAVTLAYPGFWYRDLRTGLDHARVVHAAERFTLHRPLPVEGELCARPRITAIHDKGAGRGALIESTRTITDVQGRDVATVVQTAFCLADGGLGGPQVPPPAPEPMPDRAPDMRVQVPTDPRAALIYRLSGDPNPLHYDPAAARRAGFDGPVLHGLASMGHVCRLLCPDEMDRIVEMECRFTGFVRPGERLRVDRWDTPEGYRFSATVEGRRALDAGRIRLAPGPGNDIAAALESTKLERGM
ncbi:3-alpha,7-alpha,12-alpha-trihydroxy-5-beta-cholest-24-enoyl-CoA hydratase [Roseovarius sp. TE539]|uniref:MaoC/PaaZ C-terminal domain-containing protein n=1 Tax=Roseovarius sp. TE539 TaxID=2249812 RepID=UPI000DDCF325|nr:MaoC/PaaZ C-terminal domain-containing protein [Roseovarius sp. TE539]RBI71920.1 3-alpha,7-alpha,12-alpha-trihydroxy-5-beta-cholest-24-enoyl-CoA hydratase [Roseovarius sp. TE539]